MPPLSVLMKPASGMCNMSCDYCFYCDETKKRLQESYGLMTEETLKNIIRKTILKAEYEISYAYQGGEPTLAGIEFYEKAIYYQNKYNKNRIRVNNALQTNGYLINEEWCEFFNEKHFLVGLSVDGIQETHDIYRHDKQGKGTFQRVIEAAELMDKFKVDYNILTVVNQKVAQNIETIYREYKKRGWNYQQYIACLDPLGEEHEKKEYSLTPKLYGEFLIKLFDLWYEDWTKGEQPYIRQFENYVGIVLGYKAESCEQNGVCGIQMVVEADGSVYPCDFYMLDEYRLGNFNLNRVEDIDQCRLDMGFIAKSLKISEKCTMCDYFSICKGGCQRHRDYMTNEHAYRNYLCEGYYEFFRKCNDRLTEVAHNLLQQRKGSNPFH